MNTKHTKGNWKVSRDGKKIIAESRKSAPNNFVIAEINTNFDTVANAKLIAAAPNLLNNLWEAEKILMSLYDVNKERMKSIRETIKKATE